MNAIHLVVHWAIPKTMDGFYQVGQGTCFGCSYYYSGSQPFPSIRSLNFFKESGRAGRDGLPSISLVYFSRDDASKFAYLISMQEESRKKKNEGQSSDGASLKRKQEALSQVVEYCMTAHCRRQFVLKHFGEKETDPKTICQKSCDYCSNPERIEKAIQGSDAMRAVSFQKKQASKRKRNEKAWDGKWDQPHGDDGFFENHDDDWEVEGLGITSSSTSTNACSSGSTSFVSAKSLVSRLDKLEVNHI